MAQPAPPAVAIKEANSHLQALYDHNQKLEEEVKELRHLLALKGEQEEGFVSKIKELEQLFAERLKVIDDKDNQIIYLQSEITNLNKQFEEYNNISLMNIELRRKLNILTEVLIYKPALEKVISCLDKVGDVSGCFVDDKIDVISGSPTEKDINETIYEDNCDNGLKFDDGNEPNMNFGNVVEEKYINDANLNNELREKVVIDMVNINEKKITGNSFNEYLSVKINDTESDLLNGGRDRNGSVMEILPNDERSGVRNDGTMENLSCFEVEPKENESKSEEIRAEDEVQRNNEDRTFLLNGIDNHIRLDNEIIIGANETRL